MNKIFFLLLSSTVAYNAAHAMEQYALPPMDPYALINAARRGDLQRVRNLLDGGADVNQQNTVGDTALHVAPTVVIAKLLLDRGANVNKPNKFLCAPIYPAVVYHRPEIVCLLLSRGSFNESPNRLIQSLASKLLRSAIRVLDAIPGRRSIAQLTAQLQATPDVNLQFWDQVFGAGNPNMNASHALGTLIPSLSEIASFLGRHKIIELLENWPKVATGCYAGQDAFCRALHPRVGAESPVQMLPQYAFQQIYNYVRPAVLIHDQEAVEAYKHRAEEATAKSCIIS